MIPINHQIKKTTVIKFLLFFLNIGFERYEKHKTEAKTACNDLIYNVLPDSPPISGDLFYHLSNIRVTEP